MKIAHLALCSLLPLSVCMAQDLPQIKILATGGTIAGAAAASTNVTGYKAGELGIQTLINAVPEIQEIAKVSGEQIAKISSNDMTNDVWLKVAKRVNELLEDPEIKGIVITHGTDTLEETAFFLNLVTKSDKPVVLVGAMRPATAISADGPMNLLNAVRVASDPASVGKGVMVTMNDTINGARDVTKTNTTNVATFKSPELGCLGLIEGGKVKFYKLSSKKHTLNSEFDVRNLTELPRVDILYSHIHDDRVLADACVKAGAQGIIHAGTGNGSIHKYMEPGLAEAVQKGVVVVRSSRVPSGPTITARKSWVDEGFLNSGTLNPQKARILLQLALTKTKDPQEIQRMFEEY